MNLDFVIAQIRQNCPVLGNRVAGAADYDTGIEAVANLDLPSAFVVPLMDEAGPNETDAGLWQGVTERIGVVVEFDNTADRRGQGASDQVYPMRTALWRALLNWRPEDAADGTPPDGVLPGPRGMTYAGGRLLGFDRKRLFFQFEFEIEGRISDADGYVVAGDPLTQIFGAVTVPDTGDETGLSTEIDME